MPMPKRKLSGEAQRRSSAPSGTPITAPIKNGASRNGRIACRNFQTAQPLHDQAEGRDENGGLCRRQEMQPYRRRDDRKRKTRQPRDKRGGKSG